MNPQLKDLPMDPAEVRLLFHQRAEQVHVHGDFADAAITGARRIRTRRAVTAVVAGALTIALPFGLVSRGDDERRSAPARRDSTSRVEVTPAPAPLTALARSGPPEGPMTIPYIQAGVLHLNGRKVTLPIAGDGPILFFATLSNGGVVYQVAGSNPALPHLSAGPLTFLDRRGDVVAQQPDMAQVDVDGPGDRVTAVAGTGEFVVFDVHGAILRRLPPRDAFQATSRADALGGDLVANIAGEETEMWLASLATGRTAYFDGGLAHWDAAAGLTVHEGRGLVVSGELNPLQRRYVCKTLDNYVTGETLRSWCDDTHPIGFSPDGSWMYGEYNNGPGVWVARTDDGATLLEVRGDDTTSDRLTGEFAAPTPDGTALLVAVTNAAGEVVTTSCAIADGRCHVLSDGTGAPARGWLALPDNWGRQDINKVRTDARMP